MDLIGLSLARFLGQLFLQLDGPLVGTLKMSLGLQLQLAF